MSEDTLSRVNLTADAVDRWHRLARATATKYRSAGLVSECIQDELARVEADGALTIYLVLPNAVEISMRVEPHEWAWIDGARSQ